MTDVTSVMYIFELEVVFLKKFLHLLPGADDEEVVEKEVPV